jgi:mono/diheme cytochrome c family protein
MTSVLALALKVSLVAGALLLAGVIPAAKAQSPAFVIDRTDADLVKLGRTIYTDYCASCHGKQLEGEPNWRERKPSGRMPAPPHDASGHTWHHADRLLFAITKFGVARVAGRPIPSDMPIFEGLLTDREIIASLAYIKSTWPDEIQKRHDAMNARNQ